MTLLYFLTLFPLVPALGMLLARGDRARDAVGLVGSGIIMAVTVVVAVMFFGTGPQSSCTTRVNIRARSPRCSAWCSWWVRLPSLP